MLGFKKRLPRNSRCKSNGLLASLDISYSSHVKDRVSITDVPEYLVIDLYKWSQSTCVVESSALIQVFTLTKKLLRQTCSELNTADIYGTVRYKYAAKYNYFTQ